MLNRSVVNTKHNYLSTQKISLPVAVKVKMQKTTKESSNVRDNTVLQLQNIVLKRRGIEKDQLTAK